jgi:hypothetical protein
MCAGLSASVFTSLYVGFLAQDPMAFLLFLAVTPSLIILVTQVFLNHVPFIQESELRMDTGRLPVSLSLGSGSVP